MTHCESRSLLIRRKLLALTLLALTMEVLGAAQVWGDPWPSQPDLGRGEELSVRPAAGRDATNRGAADSSAAESQPASRDGVTTGAAPGHRASPLEPPWYVRYGLLVLLALGGYLLPALFYPVLLRSTSLDPGQAAGLCLAAGGIFTTPAVLYVLAGEAFVNGEPVPWWLQSQNYVLGGFYMAFFVVLALVAWMTRGRS